MTILASLLNKSKGSFLGFVKDVKKLPKEKLAQYTRAGVFIHKNHTYIFTIQTGSKNNELFVRDFGGHIETDEHPVQAAWRELEEESLNVFQDYLSDEVKDKCEVHFFEDNLYIFVSLPDLDIRQIIKEFETRRKAVPETAPICYREVQQLVSIQRNTILKKIKQNCYVTYRNYYYGPNLWKIIKKGFILVI